MHGCAVRLYFRAHSTSALHGKKDGDGKKEGNKDDKKEGKKDDKKNDDKDDGFDDDWDAYGGDTEVEDVEQRRLRRNH